jgi:intein/homing endonuclease
LIDADDKVFVFVFVFEIRSFVTKNIAAKFRNWAENYLIVSTNMGDSIEVTTGHMFWIENGKRWKIAKKLVIGDVLKTQKGFAHITNIVRIDPFFRTWQRKRMDKSKRLYSRKTLRSS